jgi:hypothetical protein
MWKQIIRTGSFMMVAAVFGCGDSEGPDISASGGDSAVGGNTGGSPDSGGSGGLTGGTGGAFSSTGGGSSGDGGATSAYERSKSYCPQQCAIEMPEACRVEYTECTAQCLTFVEGRHQEQKCEEELANWLQCRSNVTPDDLMCDGPFVVPKAGVCQAETQAQNDCLRSG